MAEPIQAPRGMLHTMPKTWRIAVTDVGGSYKLALTADGQQLWESTEDYPDEQTAEEEARALKRAEVTKGKS